MKDNFLSCELVTVFDSRWTLTVATRVKVTIMWLKLLPFSDPLATSFTISAPCSPTWLTSWTPCWSWRRMTKTKHWDPRLADCLLLCALDSAVTAPASHESRIAIIEWWCKFIPSPLDAANIQMTSAVSAVFQIRHGQCRVEHSEHLILSGENIFAVLKVIRFAFPKIRIFSHL